MEKHTPKKRAFVSDGLPTDFDKILARESDRGAVMMAVGWLEAVLDASIKSTFRKTGRHIKDYKRTFDGPSAPLGTFWSKLLLAYALGLVPDDEYEYMQKLREVRNVMAHSLDHVDFDHPKVRGRIPLPTKAKIKSQGSRGLDKEAHAAFMKLDEYDQDGVMAMVRRRMFHMKIQTIIGVLEAIRHNSSEWEHEKRFMATILEKGRTDGNFPPFNDGEEPPYITRFDLFKPKAK